MPTDPNQYWLGHRARLREKARAVGIEALRPYEVVELLLYQSDLRADMLDLSRALIARFGTLRALLSASRDELMSVPGMVRPAADWILRTGNLIRRFNTADRAAYPLIFRVRDLIGYVAPLWRDVPAPQTWMLYTDYENRLLMRSVLCDSLGWADPMIARQVLRESLSIQASHAYLICFTGVEPLRLTRDEHDFLLSMALMLESAHIELLDCLMVGEAGFLSLNQSHQMDGVRRACKRPQLHERYLEEELPCAESHSL